jgi:hypothetical protein
MDITSDTSALVSFRDQLEPISATKLTIASGSYPFSCDSMGQHSVKVYRRAIFTM